MQQEKNAFVVTCSPLYVKLRLAEVVEDSSSAVELKYYFDYWSAAAELVVAE